jgi:hypothetical protein
MKCVGGPADGREVEVGEKWWGRWLLPSTDGRDAVYECDGYRLLYIGMWPYRDEEEADTPLEVTL